MPVDLVGDERAAFVGHTGSGKSYAARLLLRVLADAAPDPGYRIWVISTKPESTPLFAAKHFPGHSYRERRDLESLFGLRAPARVNVWAPWRDRRTYAFGREYETWLQDSIGEFCRRVWLRCMQRRERATLYVDELNRATGYRANGGPAWLRRCYTEGRGIHLGTWGGLQRPVNTQGEALSEREHLFCWSLEKRSDWEAAEDALRLPRRTIAWPDRHGLWHRRAGMAEGVYWPSIQAALGLRKEASA